MMKNDLLGFVAVVSLRVLSRIQMSPSLNKLAKMIQAESKIAILTGAGISTDSGIPGTYILKENITTHQSF